jgi:hypothetical protein
MLQAIVTVRSERFPLWQLVLANIQKTTDEIPA